MDIIKVEEQQISSSNSSNNSAVAMKNLWGLTPSTTQAALQSANTFRLTHGMFAGVPIICKDQDCPYISTCMINPVDRVLGQRCPQEAGAIIARFDMWCSHFGIDLSNPTPNGDDVVDMTMVRDLVDIEVQMLRAENKIAISADFIARTISTVDNKGRVFYEDTVSPAAEFKMTLLDKRYKILNQLNATRKDKAAMLKREEGVSTKAVGIFNKINKMLQEADDGIIAYEGAVDVDYVQDTDTTNPSNESPINEE